MTNLDPLMSSKSTEWYTPDSIIERVILILGEIDLDPCSNSKMAPNVPAVHHYTKKDDGLSRSWHGRVYMNPPYGRVIGPWVTKLVAEYRAGRATQALALLPARTDTRWMAQLREFPRCFIRGRLKFSGHQNSAPFPSVVVALGCDPGTLAQAFGDIGDVYQLVTAPSELAPGLAQLAFDLGV
jgi:hypothetical protein